MLKEERQHIMLNKLNENHRIYITALSRELNVSDDTLRRDLTEMEMNGLLTKVHGGAIPKSGIPHDFKGRLQTEIDKKREMAAKVIPFFKNGDVILIDGGTSNLEVIRQLPGHLYFTIYTNSFPIATEVMNYPNIELNFFGRSLLRKWKVTLCIPVDQKLQTIYADWLILGVCSVHPKIGLTGHDREESIIKRIMIEKASKTIVIADALKMNTAENYVIGSIGDIDYLVVEDAQKEEMKALFAPYKSKVI